MSRRCAAVARRHDDVVERQVTRWMRRVLGTIARADVAVLADVAADHPLGQACPSRISVNVMVGTDARQPRMLAAASSRSARDDATDGAELHGPARRSRKVRLLTLVTLVTLACTLFDIARSVSRVSAAVYSPGVLRLQSH